MRYLDVVLDDRPSGLWMLDDGAGAIARGRGPDGNASYIGGPTLRVPGPSGAIPYSVRTDGVDDGILLPALGWLVSGGAQSWEIWADNATDATATTGVNHMFGSTAATFQAMGIGGDFTGSLTDEVSTVGNDTPTPGARSGWKGAAILAGWHHHVWTFRGSAGTWRYYLDGKEWLQIRASVSAIANAGGATGMTGAGVTWGIARVTPTGFRAFRGLAAAALYKRELNPQEVARHYWAGRNGARPGLSTRLSRR